ncbi:MAG: hypothetical protein ACI9OE_000294 [Mariniflexile sp.]
MNSLKGASGCNVSVSGVSLKTLAQIGRELKLKTTGFFSVSISYLINSK